MLLGCKGMEWNGMARDGMARDGMGRVGLDEIPVSTGMHSHDTGSNWV
jgi:hypothetical protein